jgi:protein involved in polysaccharide export with SLBB domain
LSPALALAQTSADNPQQDDSVDAADTGDTQNSTADSDSNRALSPSNRQASQLESGNPPAEFGSRNPEAETAGPCPTGRRCDWTRERLRQEQESRGLQPERGLPGDSGPQPGPVEPPNEFQQFVSASTHQPLPMFGYELFSGVPSTFAPLDRIAVPANYVVGPGDELIVRAWGFMDLNAQLVVDREGNIYVPKVGTINVAGLKYEQLPGSLRSAVGRVFHNFDLSVSMGHLRSIQVFVMGQARHPGSYTISSLSTLANALFASGGPSPKGSLRHIQLKRDGQTVADFDFYDLLLRGDKSGDKPLLPGDVIFVPPIGPLVAISGSVNVPAIYELASATTLEQAIQDAGGLSTVADGKKVTVERIDGHSVRRVEEILLDETGLRKPLQNGDLVRVASLSPRFENAVTLRGNIAQPGRHPWQPNMRVRDLIPNRDFLLTRAYWRSQNDSANQREIKRQAEINWDYALIQRINHNDLSTRLLPFNLGKALADAASTDNQMLESGDVITIFSQNDLAVPLKDQNKFVRLEGEFETAGVYRAEPGENLRHLVMRVGGLTPQAYLYGAVLTRESVRQEQQARLAKLSQEMEKQLDASAAASSARVSTPDEAQALAPQLESQRRMVERLKSTQPTGRVVLALAPNSTVTNLPDLPLEDGDRFYVPYQPDLVNVVGEVNNATAFLFEPRKRLGDYLKLAGGPTRDGDRGGMFVMRANGQVVSRQENGSLWNGGFDARQIFPGDTIFVPQQLSKGSIMKNLKDWTQILSQAGLGAAAINVLK